MIYPGSAITASISTCASFGSAATPSATRAGEKPSLALARELQDHVKRETAPYKYPRLVEFADDLPRTTSGKIRRAQLRG